MSKLSLDDQYNLAAKIQNLVMLIGLLTDDETEALLEMRRNLLEQVSKLQAIGGTIVPLESSEHKVSHLNAMVARIDAILSINNSNVMMQEADKKLQDDQDSRGKIAAMFGLESF